MLEEENDDVIVVDHLYKDFKVCYDKANTIKEKLLFWNRGKTEVRNILNDINVTIKRGESVALISTNGSGKSTLLKLMTKKIYPNKGKVKVEGKIASSSNTTGCVTKTMTCNGTTVTMSSTCTSNTKSEYCSSFAASIGQAAADACRRNSDPTGYGYSEACALAGQNASSTQYSSCMNKTSYPKTYKMAYSYYSSWYVYTTSYSYSSSKLSYKATYASSTLSSSSTTYTYYKTYTANDIIYSKDYTISYTGSQVNPSISTY